MDPISEIKIENLHEYLEQLRDVPFLTDAVFRGVSSERKQLIPGLGWFRRSLGPPLDFAHLENKLMREFMLKSRAYLNPIPTSEFEFAAIAQHHGLPTRLLDWTKNSLAALYFSVESDSHEDGIVWIYLPKRVLIEFSGKLNEIKNVSVCFPPAIAQRIVSQQGLFTIHPIPKYGDPFLPLDKLIELGIEGNELFKFRIGASSKEAIRTQLEIAGVNRFSLFPDLDGLCQHLRYITSLNGRSY